MASPNRRNMRPGALASTALLVALVGAFVGLTAGPAAATHTATSFTPAGGPVGCEVTITGTGFAGVTSVTFNGVSATFTTDSTTQITTAVPSAATDGNIVVSEGADMVTVPGGAFNVAPATACPTISSFAPTSGAVGTSVVITGTNFTGATAVRFNQTSATFTVNSATQITATVPSGATTGPIRVTAGGLTGRSLTSFTVNAAPLPTITSFTPTSGPVGKSVVITGTNFSGTGFTTTSVKFNGVTATFTVNSATQITATVPATATTGKITVSTPGGTATSTTDFTVSTLHARNVSLRLRKHLVARGQVTATDAFSACEQSVPVKIQRRSRGGGWHTVKQTTTSSSGAYRARLNDVAGRYRARAPKVVLSSGADICQGAVSPTRRNR